MTDPMSQWLATGTTRTATVELFADQVAVEELVNLYNELDALEKNAAAQQRAVGEKSRLKQVKARIKQAEVAAAASRSLWTLRALTRVEIQACKDMHPDPEPTKVNPRDLTGEELAEYRRGAREAGEMRTLELISKSVVKVELATGEVDHMPVSTLKQMLDAEYGDYRILMLDNARKSAGDAEKGMPVPKS